MRPVMLVAKIAAASSLAFVLCGCPKDDNPPLTGAEAKDVLDESNLSSQASALQASSIDISTNFTIGKGAENAVQDLKTFVSTQLPCAAISIEDSTITVTYGAKPGNCTYKGHTFSGTHAIHVAKNDEGQQVLVDHTWTDLSNGIVKVTGTAHVTWDLDDRYRHVVYDTTWTRLSDSRTGKGSGDVTQKPLEGGIEEGIEIDGDRRWEGKSGRWDLAIQGVQARWEDPVPQAGSYVLDTPKDRSITLSFARLDATTIEVTLSSGDKSFKFNVHGPAADVDETS
jgi:hypothetical protein